jgi:hypothetical protein
MQRGKPPTFLRQSSPKNSSGRATADTSAFYRLAPDNVNFVILVITVDDFCSACNSEACLEQCREQLASVYSVKYIGPVHSVIGWRIQRDDSSRCFADIARTH